MRAKAQSLKNSAEYFKIDSAKKKMAAVSGFGGHGARNSGRKKKTISDLKQCKLQWVKNRRRIFREKIHFSRGLSAAKYEARCECSTDSDFAAHLLSLEYRR